MRTDEFDYHLPEELIAAHPAERRDASRLLVVPANPGLPPEHRVFADLLDRLRPGDLLVVNDSKVLPARLFGTRHPGGGACEVLLLAPEAAAADGMARWTAMVRPGKKLKAGARIRFAADFEAVVESEGQAGERILRFETTVPFRQALERLGEMPLPPYILARRGTRHAEETDRERYQTVYASAEGSVAAPTAGLHFTPEMLGRLAMRGIAMARVTLHVGAGTFQPIATETVEEHPIHSEHYEVSQACADAVKEARARGGRIVAVGTTSVRTLESAATPDGELRAGAGATRLMITPGYRFRVVDAILTNFHLPRSTLLCLVAAAIGRDRMMAVYAEAVSMRYRFYSYGDAMFLEPPLRQ